ncbi:potassium channel family protein [Haloprofundus salinisoli]|uniref:potassium channel family protein n=1 Tax=Haloprofundus salinisoli TaxID=2876193 RepID=UPI001CCCFEA3|nr:potassium channel family protein [Haloprofundus salinisoli]
MNSIYFVAGVLALVTVSVDLLWTTLWIQGSAGPLTSRLMKSEWQVLRQTVGDRQRVLSLSGPIILITSLAVWIALLWGGWTLLFAGGENALLDTRNTGPISWSERFYYVGYTLFTMGNGDFTPQGSLWQIATALMAGSGMLFITLSVTYILSVLDAVTQKRAFASGVSGLGEQSDEILRESWNGEEFEGLELPLNSLTAELNTLTSNHKAYPILHYFYSPKAKHAPAVSVVVFDELLRVLRFGTPDQHRPDNLIVGNARSSVEDYLETLHDAFIDPANRLPPALELDSLREAGVPTVSDEEFADSLDTEEDRRRQLLGLIDSDLREWPNGDDG